MKKLIIGILGLLLAANLYACKNEFCEASIRKVYLQSQDVHILPEGIYISLNEEMIAVSTLFSDEEGIYIVPEIMAGGFGEKYGLTWWVCPVCGYTNGFFDKMCKNISNH